MYRDPFSDTVLICRLVSQKACHDPMTPWLGGSSLLVGAFEWSDVLSAMDLGRSW